jgi:flavin-dependent dehydrogenase
MRKAKVLIIGAGPGGCAAAISLANAGISVILHEKSAFPRHRPGETLHPGVEPLLRQLGIWESVRAANYLRHSGIWVSWTGSRQLQRYGADAQGPWLGFQAWRADFDARLLDQAHQLGTDIRQPSRIDRVKIRNNRVIGVVADGSSAEADFVIDASGSRHWLAHRLGLNIRYFSPPLVVRYGYAIGDCQACANLPSLEADADGWTWTAQLGGALHHWARLNLTDNQKAAIQLPRALREMRPLGPTRAADVTWRLVDRPAGPGYFLVGDAAGVLDPASSHGVLRALMSGILAAHWIQNIATGKVDEAVAHSEYRRWWQRGFINDVSQLLSIYRAAYPCPWTTGRMVA